MESKQDTVSNVQSTCPSSGCWQSLEEWFANLSTMLQTICQWTSGGCHTNPNIEQNENESFRDHLLHSLSLLILTCLVPCILQLCPASFWNASAGSRGTGHVRFSGLAAEKLENTVNVEATRPKRFVQHCLVRVVAWKCILSRVLTAAGCWLAPRLPSVFFGTLPVIAAIA